MKNIVVISGKGGTGKTTVTASFCALAEKAVTVDCDVDASDMHLMLHPKIRRRENFTGGKYAVIDAEKCLKCGRCVEMCRFGAISDDFRSDIYSCEGCGLCALVCPSGAAGMADRMSGKWFVSDTEYGPLVHAELGIGEENSGKLVSKIKQVAADIAEKISAEWLIADGPPGTGCPVMASLSGADLAVIVTEPTLSAIHDMKRVADTAEHFGIRSAVIINKWDINAENSAVIEDYCRAGNIELLGRISFSEAVGRSVSAGIPLVKFGDEELAGQIKGIWKKLNETAAA